MIYILLSIICSTLIVIVLKSFNKFRVPTFQGIVVNYVVCTIVGCLTTNMNTIPWSNLTQQKWLPYAIILGSLFIGLFNLMGWTAQKMGMTTMSVANKLSLVIPVGIAFYVLHEPAPILKIIGIVLALLAVYLATVKYDIGTTSFPKQYYIFPFILFVGSGINDTLVNYTQHNYLQESMYAPFVIFIFATAATIGLIILFFALAFKKITFNSKSLIGGIILGIPNYFSMYFLVKALALPGYNSSFIFPINNVAILISTSIIGILLFKEKLQKQNYIGIGLACLAIIIISFS
jgi:drug/metabolite transporter (DMT)-like permease